VVWLWNRCRVGVELTALEEVRHLWATIPKGFVLLRTLSCRSWQPTPPPAEIALNNIVFSIGLKDGDRQIRLLTNILPRLNSTYILLYTRQRVIIRGRFLNAKTCCVTVSVTVTHLGTDTLTANLFSLTKLLTFINKCHDKRDKVYTGNCCLAYTQHTLLPV